MVDTTEKILLRVEFDQSEAIKQVAALQVDINKLTEANKDLAKSTGTATKEYQENARLIKNLKDEQSALNKNIDASIAAFSAEEGSLQQLKKNLILATAEYDKMGKARRESAEGKELKNSIKETTDELKSLESELGNYTRNVGNYKDAIRDMTAELNVGGINIGTLTTGFQKAKEATKIAGAEMNSFNGIMKANLIGLIVVALASLYALFTKFQPAVDKVEQAMAGLNAAFDVVIQALIKMGKGYFEVVIGYFEGLFNIGQAIYKLFTGDFAGALDGAKHSFDRLGKGVDIVKNSFNGVGTAMVDAAKAAAELTRQLQDLEDAQRGQEVMNARTEADVQRLILQSKNRMLSEKERLALLNQASKIESENFNKNRKLADDALEIAEKQIMLKGELSKAELEMLVKGTLDYETEVAKRGKISEDDLDKLKDLQIKKISFEGESMNLQEKITNRTDAIIQQGVQKRIEANKKLEESANKYRELVASNAKIISDIEIKLADQKLELARKGVADVADASDKEVDALIRSMTAKADLLVIEATNESERRAAYAAQIEADYQAKLVQLAKEDAVDEEYALARAARTQSLINLDKERVDSAIQMGVAVGQIIANSIDEAGFNLERFSKQIIILTIDVMQKVALAAIAKATVEALASADSIATYGALGLAKAAGMTALIIGATEAAKAGINAAAGGGDFMTNGPTLLMVGDNPGGRERVQVTPLSGMGQTTIHPSSGMVRMAGGGSITTGFGGYSERNSNKDGLIDYEKLAETLSKLPPGVLLLSELNKVQKSTNKMIAISEL